MKFECICGKHEFEIFVDRIVCTACGMGYRMAAVISPERFNKVKNQYQIFPEVEEKK